MDKFKSYITGLIGAIIVVIGTAYIFYGLTDIITTGKTIDQIIISGGLATLVGWFISILYSELAFIHGFASKLYLDAKNDKTTALNEITPNIDKVHIFCNKRNEQEYKVRITSLLLSVGLTYEEYKQKKYDPNDKDIKRVIRKIKKAYFEEYSYNELINGIEKISLKKKRRANIDSYRTFKYSRKIISSLFSGILFGYFGLKIAENPNWGMVIYLAIQFAMFNANGAIQYMISRNYITSNMRIALEEDTNRLYEFKATLVNNPEWYKKEEPIIKDKPTNIEIKKDNLLTEDLQIKNEPLGENA